MNAAPALLGYAAVVGAVAPHVLVRSAWPHRAPGLGVALWLALIVSFVLTVVLAVAQLASVDGHVHAGLAGLGELLHACGVGIGAGIDLGDVLRPVSSVTGLDLATSLLPLGALAAFLGAFALRLLRGGALRARHRDRLDKVGVRSARLGATVLPHEAPAAYCLPGFRPRVVVSDGAVRLLTPGQLGAVLAHERAHVAGRHHLLLAAARAFSAVVPWLPLARRAREQMPVLVEMLADDRALRSHRREELATAMYELAAGRAPKGALAAHGGAGRPGTTPPAATSPSTALLRVKRLLRALPAPHPALRGAAAAVAFAVPLLPLAVACPPGG
ncbi:M56 family metallopeptidase [Streptomyces sp. NPDC056144]|uniref:M56 family metallopeptidase n=1 Tax=unclassified Streptomyces TaxID=2593676 RepID=UPI0035DD3CB1